MKKLIVVALMAALVVTSLFAQGGAEAADGSAWGKKVEVYVPAKAGGGTDVMARALANKITKDSERTLTILNNTDGSGVVAMETVRNAKPNGSTLLQFHSTMLIKSATGLYNKKATEDFTIIGVAKNPGPGGTILVTSPDAPYNTIEEMIVYSKQKQLLMGVETGGSIHLISGMLAIETGMDVKYVEAGSDTEKLTTLVGGNIDACFVNINQAKQYVEAGKVKPIALVSATEEPLRNDLLPEVPTLVELGVDVYFSYLIMILGPKGMDSALVDEIHQAFSDAAASDEVNKILTPASMNLVFYPQEEGVKAIEKQQESLTKVVERLGLQVK
jgi:putative tricarboxylic transport membrane protein